MDQTTALRGNDRRVAVQALTDHIARAVAAAKFDAKPSEENWEERQGVVAWARAIAPDQTLKFSVAYAIS